MKSAKDWVEDFLKRDFNGPQVVVYKCFEHFFTEIQKDAYNQAVQDNIKKNKIKKICQITKLSRAELSNIKKDILNI